MAVRITLDSKQINFLTKDPKGAVGKYLTKRAIILKTRAKAQVGAKTGKLRSSIKWGYGIGALGPEIFVGSNLSYARLHHEGSRPHIITPNRRKKLKFSSKGVVIFAHRVKHPGTKPNRYLTDNLKLFKK
jgi:hypothetical protein